jgi:hypothetical protein
MYASQFAFDWFDKAPFGVRPLWITLIKKHRKRSPKCRRGSV